MRKLFSVAVALLVTRASVSAQIARVAMTPDSVGVARSCIATARAAESPHARARTVSPCQPYCCARTRAREARDRRRTRQAPA